MSETAQKAEWEKLANECVEEIARTMLSDYIGMMREPAKARVVSAIRESHAPSVQPAPQGQETAQKAERWTWKCDSGVYWAELDGKEMTIPVKMNHGQACALETLAAALSKLEAERDVLKKDKERLDWLEKHTLWNDGQCTTKVRFPCATVKFIKLREAIDAALTASDQKDNGRE